MKRILWIAAFSLALMQCARADDNSHRRLAEELVGLMDVSESTEQMMESVKQMQLAYLKNMEVSPEASEKVQAAQDQLMNVITEELSWDNFKQDYISMYAETFTEKELEGIVGFYDSSAGKAFIQKMPEMIKKSTEIVQKRMEEAGPKIQEVTRKLTEEIQAGQAQQPRSQPGGGQPRQNQ